MIDLTNRKIAEVLYCNINRERLDNFIVDSLLASYEDNEEVVDILATIVHDAGKEYFIQGYLLAKQ